MKNHKNAPVLLTFHRSGHTVYFATERDGNCSSKSTCTGYESPESFFQKRTWHYSGEDISENPAAYEGVPFIDNRAACETSQGFKWALSGPLVDVDLKGDEVEECPQPSDLFASAVSGNAFGSMLSLHKASKAGSKQPGPLDGVSIDVYVQGWKEHGATVGTIQGGKFISA